MSICEGDETQLSSSNLTSGFIKRGIFPLDRQRVLNRHSTSASTAASASTSFKGQHSAKQKSPVLPDSVDDISDEYTDNEYSSDTDNNDLDADTHSSTAVANTNISCGISVSGIEADEQVIDVGTYIIADFKMGRTCRGIDELANVKKLQLF